MRIVAVLGLVALSSCSLLFNDDDLHGHRANDLSTDDLGDDLAMPDDLTVVDLATPPDLSPSKVLGFDDPKISIAFSGASNIVAVGLGKTSDPGLSLFVADAGNAPGALAIRAYSPVAMDFSTAPGLQPPCAVFGGTLKDASFADVDGDDFSDAVTLCDYSPGRKLAMFYGSGADTFPTAATGLDLQPNALYGPLLGHFLTTTGSLSVAVAAPADQAAYVYEPNGQRSYDTMFRAPTISGMPARGGVGLITSDGYDDFVITQTPGSAAHQALGMLGGVTLTQWATLVTADTPIAARIGDLDGQGTGDALVLTPGAITAVLGSAVPPKMLSPQTIGSGANEDLVLADFDGDQVLDVAVASCGSAQNNLVVARGKHDGTFVLPPAYTMPTSAGQPCTTLRIAAGDVDGDAYPDLVMGTGDGYVYYLHNNTH
jgi:hypothetical protein